MTFITDARVTQGIQNNKRTTQGKNFEQRIENLIRGMTKPLVPNHGGGFDFYKRKSFNFD